MSNPFAPIYDDLRAPYLQEKKKCDNDGDLANNYPPYNSVTYGDIVAGRRGKDQMGGKKKHDCAKKVECEGREFDVIPEMHTMLEDGTVTHYDITDGEYVYENVPVEDLKILISEKHEHFDNYDKNAEVLGEKSCGSMKKKKKGSYAEHSSWRAELGEVFIDKEEDQEMMDVRKGIKNKIQVMPNLKTESKENDDEREEDLRQFSHKVSRGRKKLKAKSSETLEGPNTDANRAPGKYAGMQRKKKQGLSYNDEQVSFTVGSTGGSAARRQQKINKAADAGVPNAAAKAKGPILPGSMVRLANSYEIDGDLVEEVVGKIEGVLEGFKSIDKDKENRMYRRAGNLARKSLSTDDKKEKEETRKKSAKIVSAITRQKEDERFDRDAKRDRNLADETKMSSDELNYWLSEKKIEEKKTELEKVTESILKKF